MLTPELIQIQAEKRLKLFQAQFELDSKINQTIKKGTQSINQLMDSLRNDPQRLRKFLQQLCKQVAPRILDMQQSIHLLQDTEEQLRFKRERINKQAVQIGEETLRVKLSVEEMKQTIAKIDCAVIYNKEREEQKRSNIQQQTENSLQQIQRKISLFEKETLQFERHNQLLKNKKKEIEQKLGRLQSQFKIKAEQKEQQVKNQKEQLMMKLQSLEGQVSEVTEINKEYSTKQKNNFDKKLSLYLKIKKFPQYSTSFENSAKTIDQCKQELFKGIQRMNQAADTIAKFQIEAKNLCDGFTTEFKRRDEREAKIQKLKKEKQLMRDRIISIQNKIKIQKITIQENQ